MAPICSPAAVRATLCNNKAVRAYNNTYFRGPVSEPNRIVRPASCPIPSPFADLAPLAAHRSAKLEPGMRTTITLAAASWSTSIGVRVLLGTYLDAMCRRTRHEWALKLSGVLQVCMCARQLAMLRTRGVLIQ